MVVERKNTQLNKRKSLINKIYTPYQKQNKQKVKQINKLLFYNWKMNFYLNNHKNIMCLRHTLHDYRENISGHEKND